MEQSNFLRVFSIVAFLAFASVSCWATAESFHLLLSSWPLILCWIVTIGFFVIASWGSKMIVDSLNQRIYMENRGLHLLGGIFIILIFWLICIMPTNTHTFFFRNVINDKVNSDILTTQSYLHQIKSNVIINEKIRAESNKIENEIKSQLNDLESEINNSNNPGNGDSVKATLKKIAKVLGIQEIAQLSSKGYSEPERESLVKNYSGKIIELKDSTIKKLKHNMTPSDTSYTKRAERDYKNLDTLKNNIKKGKLNLNNADNIKIISDKLNDGYSTIKENQDHVKFLNKNDSLAYTVPNPVTQVKRLTSVFDVWEDFLKGNYAGHGFIFWVLISVLVDIAAFIFFDIAFKNEN